MSSTDQDDDERGMSPDLGDDDEDDDLLAQTFNGAILDEESGLVSPQTASMREGNDPALDDTFVQPDVPDYDIGLPVALHHDPEWLRKVIGEHWQTDVMELLMGASVTGVVQRLSGTLALVQFLTDDMKLCISLDRRAFVPLDETDDADHRELSGEHGEDDSTPRHGGHPLSIGTDYGLHHRGEGRRVSSGGLFLNPTDVLHPLTLSTNATTADCDLDEVDQQMVAAFEEGNKLFQSRHFQGAIENYSVALSAATTTSNRSTEASGSAAGTGSGGIRSTNSPVRMDVVPIHAILSNRSGAFLAAGMIDEAFADATQAMAVKPTSAKGYVRLGNVHRVRRNYKQARKYYSDALTRDPSNTEIQYLIRTSHVSEVYSKLANLGRISVVWTRKKRFAICSKQRLDANTQLFSDLPLFVVGCSVEGPKRYCGCCCRTLVDEDVVSSVPEVLRPSMQFFLKDQEIVPCSAGCGAYYCSEACRARALLSFHNVECRLLRAQWESALHEIAAALSLGETDRNLLRLALRVAATAVARIRAERPSNHDRLLLELFPTLPSGLSMSKALQNAAGKLHDRMSESMTTAEKDVMSSEHWQQVVNISVANAKFSQCSPWNELKLTHQELYDTEDKDALEAFLKSDEAQCCTSYAVALFPLLPHFEREGTVTGKSPTKSSPAGDSNGDTTANTKLHLSGCWKPQLVGVTTRPVQAREGIVVRETTDAYEGDARNSSISPWASASPAISGIGKSQGGGSGNQSRGSLVG